MADQKPLIGVSGPDQGGWASWLWCRWLIFLAGGQACRITPTKPVEVLKLDALILGGGADIHPSKYNKEILATIKKESKRANKINLAFILGILTWVLRKFLALKPEDVPIHDLRRDTLEFELMDEAIKKGIPVLGICRGAQLINIYWGGTLHQDISKFYTETPFVYTAWARKVIELDPNSCLAKSMNRMRVKVNSLHHQSINDLGRDLKIVARESTGVTQAIEHQTFKFVIGVQWHPEFLPLLPSQQNIFKSLIKIAQKRKEELQNPSVVA